MGERHRQQARMSVGGGEIVEVQGGHIVRSTGRKDRHSKVCTAKGLRDRRVRLSAHTAIQFYDVQDRLGYDRPSKAVDWLINKAKAAIDELDHLPPWNPTTTTTSPPPPPPLIQQNDVVIASTQHQHFSEEENNNNKYNSGFLPLETTTTSFHNYPPPPDLLSRTTSGNSNNHQDLRLSLQSFQDPILLHHQHAHEQGMFAGTTAMGFDGGSSGWSEQNHQVVAWNNVDSGGGGGFVFNAAAAAPAVAAAVFGGHGQYLSSQRGPLQSSNNPSIRAWIDPSSSAMTVDNHHFLSPATAAMGFSAPSSGGFSGFRVPARIQGEEEHDGVSVKSSSASSDSRR